MTQDEFKAWILAADAGTALTAEWMVELIGLVEGGAITKSTGEGILRMRVADRVTFCSWVNHTVEMARS
jgi:hypothetical protein